MQLLQVRDDDSWKAYHFIRRHVLFELRGHHGYDDKHPDEFKEGHVPLLFRVGGKPVGTVRLDMTDEEAGVGTVRLVAVLPQYQRQGFGKAMMGALERFAAGHGTKTLYVHAAPDAVEFYEKIGWRIVDATCENPVLTKIISHGVEHEIGSETGGAAP